MKKSFKTVLTVVLLFSLSLTGCTGSPGNEPVRSAPVSDSKEKVELTLGTSSLGSALYAVGVAMSDTVNKNSSKVSIMVEPVGGSDATANALSAGNVDLALLNADSAFHALNGTGKFTNPIELRVLAQGQEAIRQIISLKEKNIVTFADMAGKRYVANQSALADTKIFSNALMREYGLSDKDLNCIEVTESKETLENMKNGAIDAALIPAGLSSGSLIELSQTRDISFMDIPEDILEKIIEQDLGPAWHIYTVPANTYKGQDYPYNAIASTTLLVARADIDEDILYELVKSLFDNQESLHNAGGSAKEWSVESSMNIPVVPFHAGAKRYFEELGVWKADFDIEP